MTRTVQTLQRDRDKIRTVLDQKRASTANSLRRQLEESVAATREAQKSSNYRQTFPITHGVTI
jgi:hypothetical protein